MAKVTLDPIEDRLGIIYGYIRRKTKDISQTEMAEALDISQQTYSYRLNNECFSIRDLLGIFRKLKTSDSDILRLMRCL